MHHPALQSVELCEMLKASVTGQGLHGAPSGTKFSNSMHPGMIACNVSMDSRHLFLLPLTLVEVLRAAGSKA